MTLSVSDVTMKSTLMSQWARKLNILQDFSILVCLDSFSMPWQFSLKGPWHEYLRVWVCPVECFCVNLFFKLSLWLQSDGSRSYRPRAEQNGALEEVPLPAALTLRFKGQLPSCMAGCVPKEQSRWHVQESTFLEEALWHLTWLGATSQMCPLDGHTASKLEPPMNLAKWPIWSRPQCNQYTI